MKISIFGLGYVGTIGIGCLAQDGHEVIGVDITAEKVAAISNGNSPIVEIQIDDLIAKYYSLGRISATTNAQHAIKNTDVSFICVGTPSTDNGHLDLRAVFNVAKEIALGLKEKESFHTIVVRSTVLPGTHAKLTKVIEDYSAKKADRDFTVVLNPEFLREGCAVADYYTPPFTLIGTNNPEAIEIMEEIYKTINAPFLVTEVEIAELMKFVNNSFHAFKITFANEIGNICKKLHIDSHKLMEIFCLDKKLNLSEYYLKPGFAYGGSCLPKDLKALQTIAHDLYLSSPVLENVDRSNEHQKQLVFEQIIQFDKKRIGFLGLSFKAGTDDLRYSPIIDIIERLVGKGFEIGIFDRNVQLSKLIGANRRFILERIPLISQFITDDPEQFINSSDVIVITNREKEFQKILTKVPQDKIIYDLVNLNLPNRSKLKNYIGLAW